MTEDLKQNDLTMIQSELNAPKNQKNAFGNYMYRNCEDIQSALKPLLVKYNCKMIISDSIEVFAERIYMVATVTFTDSKGEVSTTKALAREADSKKGMSSEQVSGCASSYARKYALGGLFLIDDQKDPDSMDNSKNDQQAQQNDGKVITHIDKFVAVWQGGKIYGNSIWHDSIKYTITNEQIAEVKKSPKYKE